jgi:hypothetical protein
MRNPSKKTIERLNLYAQRLKGARLAFAITVTAGDARSGDDGRIMIFMEGGGSDVATTAREARKAIRGHIEAMRRDERGDQC